MRHLGHCLPVVLLLALIGTPAARAAPAPPPTTPVGIFDAFPPAAEPDPRADGPAGAPLGISILGFGRLTLPADTSIELLGPQALVVVVGFPLVSGLTGSAAVGRAAGENGRAAIEGLREGRTVRLQPGDWLFLQAGSAGAVASDGAEVVAYLAMVESSS